LSIKLVKSGDSNEEAHVGPDSLDLSHRHRSTICGITRIGRRERLRGFTPEQITWKAVGNGIEVATLSGDPAKPGGFYVIRVKFPPGLFSAPHFHPEDRNVTVIKGTWYTGTGDTFDLSKAVPLKTGSFMFHPARGVHWDGAKDEEVIVEISGIGPGTTIPVKPDAGTFISTNK